jgi:formylglycine-generating enzyme required for sulfatase activity/predicted Ser/Thr protein kinase
MRCLNCHEDNIEVNTELCPKCGIHLPTLLRDTLPCGTLIHHDKYQIGYPLAQGGFGITYLAVNTVLQQTVAIKEYYPRDQALREGITGSIIIPTDQAEAYSRGKKRFLKEAQILARFKHPNIVQVLDFFEERNTAYLVMELIEGYTLKNELKSNSHHRLSESRVKEVMDTLVISLGELHENGIYHLDIKPDNVMITKEGKIVLVDFGSARYAVNGDATRRSGSYTLQYAPPELFSGEDISAASDIFELGMMLCELLSGELPPDALKRLFNNNWSSDFLGSPWRKLVEEAIRLNPQERPQNVQLWWQQSCDMDDRPSLLELSLPKREKTPIEIWETNFNIIQVDELGTGSIINEELIKAEYYFENLNYYTDLEMILIPGGEFLMGTPEEEDGHQKDESPQHRVKIQPFGMGKYPVTQLQWSLIMGNNPSRFRGDYRPVDSVSWYEAKQFCDRLSELTGRKYRLPTESEWEYACRAHTTTAYSTGDYIGTDFANYNASHYCPLSNEQSRQTTTNVDQFMPNPFGLYDMHGNVWEWCEDWWHENYEGAPDDGSIWTAGGNPVLRVIRGGSWLYFYKSCRSGNRNWYFVDRAIDYLGFRVVCELQD